MTALRKFALKTRFYTKYVQFHTDTIFKQISYICIEMLFYSNKANLHGTVISISMTMNKTVAGLCDFCLSYLYTVWNGSVA